jgi:tetratricopeptide (TPR) repeat protein
VSDDETPQGTPRSTPRSTPQGTPQSLRAQIRAARLRLADSAADLGTLLRLLGEYTEAERLLRQALEIYEADRAGHRRTPPDRSHTLKELS